MPRFSKDPRTFPDICQSLLQSIQHKPRPLYTFKFSTGNEADQFKALLTAFRTAFVSRREALRKQADFEGARHADHNYIFLASYGIHLVPPKTGFDGSAGKLRWQQTAVDVHVIDKSQVPVAKSAMEQLLAQTGPLDPPEDIHKAELMTDPEEPSRKSAYDSFLNRDEE
jgi:hypothetical protein